MLWADLKEHSPDVEFHNRVLWNYRGSMITVMDIVKRLELYSKNVKDYENLEANQKLEFYQQNWKGVLQELIDQELIYQDAIDHNMQVTDAECRDQLVRLYGENYITSIDEMGLTMKEALSMIRKDTLTQRMTYFRIQYQARAVLTPGLIAQTYVKLCKEQPETDIWTYQTISFKGPTEIAIKTAFKWNERLLTGLALEECQEQLKEEAVTVSVGRMNKQSNAHLSSKYLEILAKLKPQEWSAPITFKEDSKEGLVRLFFLQEKVHQAPPSYAEVRDQLENHLYQEAVAQESQKYIVKLRRQLEQEQGPLLQQAFNQTTPLFFVK